MRQTRTHTFTLIQTNRWTLTQTLKCDKLTLKISNTQKKPCNLPSKPVCEKWGLFCVSKHVVQCRSTCTGQSWLYKLLSDYVAIFVHSFKAKLTSIRPPWIGMVKCSKKWRVCGILSSNNSFVSFVYLYSTVSLLQFSKCRPTFQGRWTTDP